MDFQASTLFEVLLPLGVIIFLSKLLSIGARKIGLPQVIGMLLTGVLLGSIVFIPNHEYVMTNNSMVGVICSLYQFQRTLAMFSFVVRS